MLPIYKEDKLSVEIITECWSREIQPSRSRDELLDFLEVAWWRGELKTDTSFTPLALLKSMFRSAREGDLTDVIFVTKDDATVPLELADGSLLFDVNDLKPQILVPSNDPETWTDASCAPAFEALAQKASRKHYSDRTKHYSDRTIQFLMMEVYRDQFVRLLKAHGLRLPKFWRPAISKPLQLKEQTYTSKDGKAFLKETPPAGLYVRNRGPKPIKFERAKKEMRRDIEVRRQTVTSLSAMPEKVLKEYGGGVSRDTARRARTATLSEIVDKSNPDK